MVLSSCSTTFVACPVLCVLQLKITQSLLHSFTFNSAVLCSHQKIEKMRLDILVKVTILS